MDQLVWLFVLVLTIGLFYALLRLRFLREEVRALRQRLDELVSGAPAPPLKKEKPTKVPSTPSAAAPAPEPPPPPKAKPKPTPAPAPAATASPSAAPTRLHKFEKQFVENWTGILGAVIMVIGVGFFGVYAALKVSAFFRFVLVCVFAGFLVGLYAFLRRKEDYLTLAYWLRSSAGGIFLFACVGASQAAGLQWIESAGAALALLLVGIAVNLLLGYVGKQQYYASFHIVISLVALAVMPASQFTLPLGAVVVLFGVLLTFRERWDGHLLISISAFFAYHLHWFYRIKQPVSTVDHAIGIICLLFVGLSALAVHYRRVYQSEKFQVLPFLTHLSNWFYLGIGLLMHSTGSRIKTIFIAVGAIAAFALARRARKLEISWLYRTDTLVSLAVGLLALYTLTNWDVGVVIINSLMVLEVLIFMRLMVAESDVRLYRVGVFTLHILLLSLAVQMVRHINFDDVAANYVNALIFTAVSLLTLAFLSWAQRKSTPEKPLIDQFLGLSSSNTAIANFSFGAAICGLLPSLAYLSIAPQWWAVYVASAFGSGLLYWRHRYDVGSGLTTATIGFGFALYCISWWQALTFRDLSGWALVGATAPLLLHATLAALWCKAGERYYSWLGIYALMTQLMLLAYHSVVGEAPMLPGVLWLILSILALEGARYLRDRKGNAEFHLQAAGIALVALFLLRHIFVHLQLESYLGPVKTRLAIELFAIGVFAHWLLTAPKHEAKGSRLDTHVRPLFLELIIGFALLLVSIEVDAVWQPVVWVCFALATLFLGIRVPAVGRLQTYSVVFSVITSFHAGFLTAADAIPTEHWYRQSNFMALWALLLQLGYLVCLYRFHQLDKPTFPPSLGWLQRLTRRINQRLNWFVFYPFFGCVALYLYSNFDSSMLTLFWVVECFAVFSLSIFLKEITFRYAALAGIAICVLRLIFHDLASESTIVKAFVFLGVGVIMLIMNFIWKKYKVNFE